jgi:hypothetical protein
VDGEAQLLPGSPLHRQTAAREEDAMNTEVLERHFAAMGARVRLEGTVAGAPRIDVRADGRGEYFDISFADDGQSVSLEVVDLDRASRHLLLLARVGAEKSKFLCGHDERHWFVAAVPENAPGVTGVRTARIALQPELVRAAVTRRRPKDALSRRNAAYVRQGEWFFVPVTITPTESLVLRNEPLRRGGGTAHVMELAYRRGGERVWVSNSHPAGISEARYARLTQNERRGGGWGAAHSQPRGLRKGARSATPTTRRST